VLIAEVWLQGSSLQPNLRILFQPFRLLLCARYLVVVYDVVVASRHAHSRVIAFKYNRIQLLVEMISVDNSAHC